MSRRDSVLQFLRRVVAPPGDTTDAELLGRFVRQRDEAAFKALLHRHGPAVLGVCRRVLHNEHDAEDAFQATFLVLSRKAGTLGKPQLLGNWLYGVACRIALKARAENAERRRKETQAVRVPVESAVPAVVWADLRPVLDEEVSRLPDRYRAPFVLCYLQGKTNEEAAQMLGCPKGTVLSRLATAREKLRSRLVRRGITLTAGVLVAALSAGVASALPPLPVGPTVRAALVVAAGQPVAGVVSARVARWAEGVMRAMLLSQVKVAAAVLVALGMVTAGAGVLTNRVGSAPETNPAQQAERQAADAKPKGEAVSTPQIKNARVMDVLVDVDTQRGTITFVSGVKEELFGYEGPFEERRQKIKAKVEAEGKKPKTARVAADAELRLSFRMSPSVANSLERQLAEFETCKWLFASIEVTGVGDDLVVKKMVVWR
jgi:RNA polymerase sigma factor (sigma-70 family)